MKTINTLLAILLLAGSIGLGATSAMATEPDFGGPLPDEIQDYENDGSQ
ncbi:MAG: hypothetical protein O7B35_14770 [Deltaproteobacteria bacterium]|nr:hypothetical protein [Deltaproteobacteria bacterium]